jgi:putative hemolysin
MSAIGTELLLILLLVVVNGLLAMSELALVSVRRIRLEQRAAQGDAGARAALELLVEPGRLLSTIQIGITTVGILAGAFGGATLAQGLEDVFGAVPLLAPYQEPLALLVVVLGITYLSLIIGELVPKQIALVHAERISVLVARPMQLLARLAAPVVWLLTTSTHAVVRLLGIPASTEAPISEEEIRLLVQQATHHGVLAVAEQEMVEGTLGLGDEQVSDLMTPRPHVVWLDLEDPPEENWAKIAASSHTYYPVCEGELDTVLGVVSVTQLWKAQVRGETVDLRTMPLLPPTFVPQRQPALKLLEVFQANDGQLALILEEHGRVMGVVTPVDLLEAMLGDAVLFGKRRGYQPVSRPDGSWLLDGLMPLDEVKDVLGADEIPGAETGRYQSLGGYLFSQLGHVPRTGEVVESEDWRLEIVDMDGLRIDKVLATSRRGDSGPAEEPESPASHSRDGGTEFGPA